MTNPRIAASDACRLPLLIAAFCALTCAAGLSQTYELVHAFRNSGQVARESEEPSQSGLTQGQDGFLYGTSYWGGAAGVGTVYRMDLEGNVTTIHSFAYADGANPAAALVQAVDGLFYGVTTRGGAQNRGTVFQMDYSGKVTRLHSFQGEDGSDPRGALIEASDGDLYGTTYAGGAHDYGTVFRMSSAGLLTTLHSFDRYVDGSQPAAGLRQVSGGPALYGTTSEGGPSDQGTVFRVDPSGSLTTVHAFDGSDGSFPFSGLIQASDGLLYGTTRGGGLANNGTVFRLDSSANLTTLHSFDEQVDGGFPFAALLQAADGHLYGTTAGTGYGSPYASGTVFEITLAGDFHTVFSFADTAVVRPHTPLVQASDGKLYGTTIAAPVGTAYVAGSVFRVEGGDGITVLHTFGWSEDGASPAAAITQAADGRLYGSTTEGGVSNMGTVWRRDADGNVITLHSFEGPEGASPRRIIQSTDGKLYGSALVGGWGAGTLFTLSLDGQVTPSHLFGGFAEGSNPSDLIEGLAGKLYGTCRYGGEDESGFIFSIDDSGDFAVVSDFDADVAGSAPVAALLKGDDGYLYGTTLSGGELGNGTVFRLDAEGNITPLHSFGGTDGAAPQGGLMQANFLFGTTSSGGEAGLGTVFRVMPTGESFETIHSFSYSDGMYPTARLTSADGSEFWGTTLMGGQNDAGVVFRMDHAGHITFAHSLNRFDGFDPSSELVQASDGWFYGTARGGPFGDGVVFRLTDAAVAVNEIVPNSGPAEGGVAIDLLGGGFQPGIAVSVGGGNATDVAVLDPTFLYMATPTLTPGTLNDVSVTISKGERSGVTASRANAYFADFVDVPQGDPFHEYVEKIFRRGITAGCGVPGGYCPLDSVTRGQMAVFLLKAEHGSAYVPPPCTAAFADVPCPSMFADWIEQLAAEGITAGCGGGNYCPTDPVTRAQMAVFLLKAEHGSTYAPPPCTGVFGDVLCPSLFADWIERLVGEKITAGCGGWNYCPASPNTRGQMAAFLVKTFGL